MAGRRWLWLSMMLLPVISACTNLDSPPPKIRPQAERNDEDRETGVFEFSGRQTIAYPLPDGRQLFWLRGTVRALVTPEGGTGDLLDAEAQSLLPQYRSRFVAGRLRYRLGDPIILLDHGLDVRAPERRATMRAERGSFNSETMLFELPGRTRLTYDGSHFWLTDVRAKLDLRTATGRTVHAQHEGQGRGWRGDAESLAIGSGQATLSKLSGQLLGGGPTTGMQAARAIWNFAQKELVLDGGVVVSMDGGQLRTARAVYRRADNAVTASGVTTISRAGLTAQGTGGRVDLTSRNAVLQGLTATIAGDKLRADSATIAESAALQLTNVRATLANGTRLQAGRATYEQGVLTASSGVRAESGGGTLVASRATRRPGQGWQASGSVSLTAPGGVVTGGSLTADEDLKRASLTPVSARGKSSNGSWTLNASSGSYAQGGNVTLSSASGTFRGSGRQVRASAGRVVYQQGGRRVVFEGGFRAVSPSDGLTLTADRAVYDLDSETFRATGHVRGTADGIKLSGESWSYGLGESDGGTLRGGRQPRTSPAPVAATGAAEQSAPKPGEPASPKEPEPVPGTDLPPQTETPPKE